MNEKLVIFICTLSSLIIMLFFTPAYLANGFLYYLLIFLLFIINISLLFIFLLKNIDEKLNSFITKIKVFISVIIMIKDKILFLKTSMTIVILATISWLSFVGFLIYKQKRDLDISSLLDIKSTGLSLNEWGDFSAGFIAPLALGWLAYSIYYQKKEFEEVHSSLKDQISELEIEKYYNSYEKYINKIDYLINSISSTMNTISLEELNKKFILANPNDFLNIATNVKKIYLLNKSLKELLNNYKDNRKLKIALDDLSKQYDMLYKEDINLINEILLKYYFLIAISDKEIKHELKYSDFKKLSSWINKEKKETFLVFIDKIEGESLFYNKLDPAFESIIKYTDLLE